MESILFTKKEVEVSEETENKLQTTVASTKDLAHLKFVNLGEQDQRKLIFDDQGSLGLQALKTGLVDFKDERVSLKAAGTRAGLGHQLVEVDLGDVKSVK